MAQYSKGRKEGSGWLTVLAALAVLAGLAFIGAIIIRLARLAGLPALAAGFSIHAASAWFRFEEIHITEKGIDACCANPADTMTKLIICVAGRKVGTCEGNGESHTSDHVVGSSR